MFYDRLNKLCKQIGSNVTDISVNHLGVSSATPTGWKRGAFPRSDVVIKAARFFNVSTDYLLGLDDEPFRHVIDCSSEENCLIENLRAADPRTRELAIAAMQTILQVSSKHDGKQQLNG